MIKINKYIYREREREKIKKYKYIYLCVYTYWKELVEMYGPQQTCIYIW